MPIIIRLASLIAIAVVLVLISQMDNQARKQADREREEKAYLMVIWYTVYYY